MDQILPSEILDIIATFAKDARLRLVNKAFCKATNKAIIDYVSPQRELAYKGDLFSIIMRPYTATLECSDVMDCVTFYLRGRSIPENMIKQSHFSSCCDVICDRELMRRVYNHLTDKNAEVTLSQFSVSAVFEFVYAIPRYSPQIIRALNKFTDNTTLLRSNKCVSGDLAHYLTQAKLNYVSQPSRIDKIISDKIYNAIA